jgi:hypothetical protein
MKAKKREDMITLHQLQMSPDVLMLKVAGELTLQLVSKIFDYRSLSVTCLTKLVGAGSNSDYWSLQFRQVELLFGC